MNPCQLKSQEAAPRELVREPAAVPQRAPPLILSHYATTKTHILLAIERATTGIVLLDPALALMRLVKRLAATGLDLPCNLLIPVPLQSSLDFISRTRAAAARYTRTPRRTLPEHFVREPSASLLRRLGPRRVNLLARYARGSRTGFEALGPLTAGVHARCVVGFGRREHPLVAR